MTMKCKRCGYRASDIAHMSAHYRKAHPKVMASRKTKSSRPRSGSYCPTCGKKR